MIFDPETYAAILAALREGPMTQREICLRFVLPLNTNIPWRLVRSGKATRSKIEDHSYWRGALRISRRRVWLYRAVKGTNDLRS